MEHNKTHGPDNFLAKFYQTFREIIKGDLLELFGDVLAGNLSYSASTLRKLFITRGE
jgi:hypothetical protein